MSSWYVREEVLHTLLATCVGSAFTSCCAIGASLPHWRFVVGLLVDAWTLLLPEVRLYSYLTLGLLLCMYFNTVLYEGFGGMYI